MNIEFTPATTKRVSEVIYEQIYKKIVAGELKVGDKLPSERELAEQFGRSRPTVREALRMLEQDGLIDINVGTNGGAVVKKASFKYAEQQLKQLVDVGGITKKALVDYRRYSDNATALIAMKNRTEEDINLLKEILVAYKHSVNDSNECHRVDIQFHKAVAQASHNELCILISDALTTMWTDLFWDVAAEKMESEEVLRTNRFAFESHSILFDAIVEQDEEKLRDITKEINKVYLDFVETVV